MAGKIGKIKTSVINNFELNELSILSLIGLFLCVVPVIQFIGVIIIMVALIINTIKLGNKTRRKSLAVNIAICVLSLTLFMATNILFYGDDETDTSTFQTTKQSVVEDTTTGQTDLKVQQEAQIKAQEEAARKAQVQAAARQAQIDSAQFIGKRELALIVKDPDASKGKIFKVWGKITQFDAATGTSSFRANVAESNTTSYGSFQGDNSVFDGNEVLLKDFVTGDLFVATVEVYGSYNYATQIGGNTTVPRFTMLNIEHK